MSKPYTASSGVNKCQRALFEKAALLDQSELVNLLNVEEIFKSVWSILLDQARQASGPPPA